ncbi:peptidylprolyl isomerase [Bacillus aquiflavi]|uniref:Foldase protein PrsA n=1 Tax=Bacillus aquiflavi TaxID=2672567 RepID=A0A6B3VSU4_9BACI|nr:peptidylprolyl isomerase [Bacillus aquiflavi]MBA4535666.1 peptidylprolyl isomerase [Bacillus aquiflavi]NEY80042.1 peptidylprolyl isomerase PrsA [Bacillus aquiflavi]UAC48976.1 peptidylprolyl isomerase [Bacillus aquiflavi]
MKKWILSMTLAAGVISLGACSNNGASGNIAETKAGNVTKDELYEVMKERYGEQTLQELVFEKILSDKYEVSDKEIKKAVEDLEAQYGPALEQYSKEEVKRLAKFQLLQEKAVTKDIKVTEEEMKEYYENYKPEIKARHILVEDEQTAKDIKAKLDEGAKFEDLALEHSNDPMSAQNGGDLGWFGSGQMVPEFDEAAFKLKVDEISAPVQTDNGWHIIQVTEKKEKKSYDEMKKDIEHDIKMNKIDNTTIQKAMERELKEAKVKVKDKDFKDTFKSDDQADKQ